MSSINIERVQALFDEALTHTPQERIAFLEQACKGDSALQREVAELLKHHALAPPDFLEPARHEPRNVPRFPHDHDPLIGKRVGRYLLKRVIASGGMGTVYEAEQDRPKRIVALKIMNAGLSSRVMMRRFEYESEILARLKHPHIAQVYEAGTHEDGIGRSVPYFAMEYIEEARPITQYVHEEKLSIRRKLKLFTQICDAVQHGHQKGIIHRDLKPSNILVDAQGQVKIIDFGVARITDSDLAVTTMRTNVGELIGTLRYMSPDQCEADPANIDTRSDVYSLGVVLFELLTGRLPYDVSHRSIPSATRIICEEPPIAPSTFSKSVKGDIEILVLKALEKDRANRYESAAALALDVRRYVRGEPIAAKPPNRWTTTVHWVAYHPRLVSAGVSLAIATVILSGTLIATWFLNYMPWRIVMTKDRSEVRLVSYSERPIHAWTSVFDGFRTAELIDRPNALGGGKLALLGFAIEHPGPFHGALCAFDIDDDLDNPVWQGVIEEHNMPSRLVKERGYVGSNFYVHNCMTFDIFDEHPGLEIVVAHQHHHTTHTALRIYDLLGHVLYQVWMDTQVHSIYWLKGPRLLVVAGLNGAAFWNERGHPEVEFSHPSVVFALRPRLTHISNEYVQEEPGDGPLDPVWYRYVGPPKASDWIRSPLRIEVPHGRAERDRFMKLAVPFHVANGAGIEWIIDEHGHEVPGSRRTDDQYERYRDELPDLNWIKLQDLPPIRNERLPGE